MTINHQPLHIPDVLASMIHDIKNRLFGAAVALNEDSNVNIGKISKTLFESAARMDRMLVAYKLLNHRSHANLIAMADVNIGDMVEDVVLQITQESEIQFELNVCYAKNWILSRDLVTDILVNAIGNAGRYARTRIKLTVALDKLGWLAIEVNDDGIGFSVEGPVHGEWHSGVGLFVARRIMALHCLGGARGVLLTGNGSVLGGAFVRMRFPPERILG